MLTKRRLIISFGMMMRKLARMVGKLMVRFLTWRSSTL
jgi:hypothetical protein